MKLIQGKYLLCALMAMLACGCSESEAVFSESAAEPSYAIAISVNDITPLPHTDVIEPNEQLRGKQHVTRVFLFVYKENGDDYVCVAGEEVKWKHRDGAEDGLDTKEQSYRTKYQGYEDNVNYLFLAMGFDDASITAFGEPELNVALINNDTKLSDKYFELKTEDVELIAKSEFFAGSQILTKEELKNGAALQKPIDLYRRVAGVAGYFKNLPASIDGVKGVKTVAKVKLCLYTSQNIRTYFLPRCPAEYTDPEAVPDNSYIDCIYSPYSNSYDDEDRKGLVLASYEVGNDNDDNGEFTLAAYLLPIAASSNMFNKGESTLQLTFYDEDGLYITHRNILQRTYTTKGTGIIPDDDEAAMHYPMRANHFYRIGEKDNPVDLGGSNSTIYIEIDPVWDEYYGGSMDNDNAPGGIGIDKEWGEHDGGNIDKKN